MTEPRISLDQWQALVAVVESGSHARAAEVLHKTQSTITYAIRKIESLLDVKAFEIRGRRAVLTPTGQLLYRRAKVLLEEAGGLEAAARRVSAGWEAEIRIAMEHVFPAPVMFGALDRLGRESPHTHVELFETVLAGTAEMLTRGEVDLAIAPAIPAGFFGDALLRMRLLPVARPDHALHALGRDLTPADLRGYRHLVVRESGSARSTKPQFDSSQRWTLSSMATSIQAARLGYGFGWIAEDKIREELASGTLKPLPLPGGERFGQLYLVYAERDSAGPGALRLGELLRETVKETCPAITSPPPAATEASAASAATTGSGRRTRGRSPRSPSS